MSILEKLFLHCYVGYLSVSKLWRRTPQEEYTLQLEIISRIYDCYARKGCPCRYPRWCYWTGKVLNSGIGVLDWFQNTLIAEALKRNLFEQSKPTDDTRLVDACLQCPKCGATYLMRREEWRMGADFVWLEQTRKCDLEPIGAPPPPDKFMFGPGGYQSSNIKGQTYPRFTYRQLEKFLTQERTNRSTQICAPVD